MKITIGTIDIILTDIDPNKNAGLPFLFYKIEQSDELLSLFLFIKEHHEEMMVKSIFIQVPNVEDALEEIKKKIKFIVAAGGVVTKGDDILWIFRLGKWDLPKGKVEKNENFAAAALREVEEETGVKANIITFICSTFHTYWQNEKFYLKETKWYAMESCGNENLVPQLEENISEVKWINKAQISTILKDTYQTIRDVFENFAEKNS